MGEGKEDKGRERRKSFGMENFKLLTCYNNFQQLQAFKRCRYTATGDMASFSS